MKALDFSDLENELTRNPRWTPDDQDLVYTAINHLRGDYEDADEDCAEQVIERLLHALRAAHQRLNTPEVEDFAKGVVSEAQHQRARWPAEQDAGKGPLDWFWLIGFLAQKAAFAAIAGDVEKAKHHTISTAAALANWHAALTGEHTAMRPGIEPPKEAA